MTYDRVYSKRWRHDRHRGIERMRDPRPVRMHIVSLTGAGWSARAIAGAAGVSPAVVSDVSRGQTKRIRRGTAAAILAVDPGSLPRVPSRQTSEPFVPRIGVVRRLQALLRIGWTHTAMREHCGLRTQLLISQQGRWATRSTHDKVATMYRDLASQPGPSQRTKDRAARLGYSSPLDWDDIDRDPELVRDDDEPDAAVDVDEVAIERRMAGDRSIRLSQSEQIELVRRWKHGKRAVNQPRPEGRGL